MDTRIVPLRAWSLLALMLLAGCTGSQPARSELEKFQGTWYSVSTESDGKRQTGEDQADLHSISGNHCIVSFGGRVVGESLITLEPGDGFGRITFQMTKGQYQGMTWVGIYQADGDALQWNGGWTSEVTAVPPAFATATGDHYFLRRVRRVVR